MPPREGRLLFTCEHGGHDVPRAYRSLFAGRRALLRSHRGWDAGALLVAQSLARTLRAPLIAATTTRLLVDLNRSAHNPAVFAGPARSLPRDARAELLARHHRPHRERVRNAIARSRAPTLHLAVHSFTPEWNGKRRSFAIGILYDPRRERERAFAAAWQRRLRARLGTSAVRRNAPYRGVSDGLTSALRREFPEERYLGIELELNQRAIRTPAQRRRLAALLATTLRG